MAFYEERYTNKSKQTESPVRRAVFMEAAPSADRRLPEPVARVPRADRLLLPQLLDLPIYSLQCIVPSPESDDKHHCGYAQEYKQKSKLLVTDNKSIWRQRGGGYT